jgi:formylglycine-generating enzyme required for sulfatase activity
MTIRTFANASVLALLGCVPETRVDARDVPIGGSEMIDLDIASSDQLSADVGREVGSVDGHVEDRPDADRRDVVTLDVFVDAGDADDATDSQVAPSDRAVLDEGVGALDVHVDVVAAETACPACVAANAAAICSDGDCRIDRCNVGFGDCNAVYADGCETPLTSPSNCGTCGVRCSGAVCSAGTCVRQRSCVAESERGCGMGLVLGGAFEMGSAEASVGGVLSGRVAVSSIIVDTHEVTVARFRRFWNIGHPAPSMPVRYPNGTAIAPGPEVLEPLTSARDSQCNWSAGQASREEHPLNCVNWATALAFCVWDGGRLPTEAELEYLSRHRAVDGSPSPRRFPWGNEPPVEMYSTYPRSVPCERAQFEECVGEDGARTRRVGRFSSNGAFFDIAGNVAEWAADSEGVFGSHPCWAPVPVNLTDPVCVDPGVTRAARGGGFAAVGASSLHGSNRVFRAASTAEPELGFRCVRSP